MKRILNGLVLLSIILLVGCGSNQTSSTSSEWTRVGAFTDDEGRYLMVTKSETEGYEGWSVGYNPGDAIYGWVIQQEGDTLKGDLVPPGEDGEYVVTVKEEGEDGLLLVTPDGEEHSFKPMDLPEIIATVKINITGSGQVAYAYVDEEVVFNDAQPFQSSFVNLTEPTTLKIGAKANEGSKFVKWTLNGQDYSTDEIITVEVSENSDFVAVFE